MAEVSAYTEALLRERHTARIPTLSFLFSPLANTSFKLRLLPESKEGKCHHSILPSNQNIPPAQAIHTTRASICGSRWPKLRSFGQASPQSLAALGRKTTVEYRKHPFPSEMPVFSKSGARPHITIPKVAFFLLLLLLYGDTPAPNTRGNATKMHLQAQTMDTATKLMCRMTQTRKRRPTRKESTKTCHSA